MKVCTKCKVSKSINDFHTRPDRPLGRQSECKQCCNARKKQYRLDNKEKVRADNKRRNPGWDINRYNKYLAIQEGRCAICKSTEPGLSDWSCDHNHDTNEPRGLLCVRCNAGLGYFKDNPEYLKSAIEYLKQWN